MYLECGCQCTGGNYTDWQTVPNFDNLGFPIAEVSPTGEMIITKVHFINNIILYLNPLKGEFANLVAYQ